MLRGTVVLAALAVVSAGACAAAAADATRADVDAAQKVRATGTRARTSSSWPARPATVPASSEYTAGAFMLRRFLNEMDRPPLPLLAAVPPEVPPGGAPVTFDPAWLTEDLDPK
jgi:hypothetical protein